MNGRKERRKEGLGETEELSWSDLLLHLTLLHPLIPIHITPFICWATFQENQRKNLKERSNKTQKKHEEIQRKKPSSFTSLAQSICKVCKIFECGVGVWKVMSVDSWSYILSSSRGLFSVCLFIQGVLTQVQACFLLVFLLLQEIRQEGAEGRH